MKKLYAILILIAFGITATHAQSKGNELMKQAQASLDNKEYVKARYLFLQAYNSFVSAGNALSTPPLSTTGKTTTKRRLRCCRGSMAYFLKQNPPKPRLGLTSTTLSIKSGWPCT